MATSTKAANEALKKVNDQLDCAICLQPFTDPKLLSCFHVFCQHCLAQLVVKSQDGLTVTCPECRRPTPLLQSGVAGLQSAFHVHRLFEIQDTLEKVKEPQKALCESSKCNKVTATGFCRHCGKFVCEKCTAAHHLIDTLASHQIVSIADIQADTTTLVPPKRKVMYCPKHHDNPVKIFCETCQELICNDCTIRLHKDHQYDLITDVFPKHQDKFLAELKPVRQHLETINKALQVSDARRKEIGDQRQAILADIHRRIDQLHHALDQRRAELVGQLDQLTQQKLKNLAAQRDRIELVQTQLLRCLEYVDGCLKTGTEGEILAMKAPVVRQIQQIVPEIKPDTLEKADMLLAEDAASKMTELCHQLGVITTPARLCHSTGDGLKAATVGENVVVTLHSRNKFKGTFIAAELVCSRDGTKVKCNVTKVEDSKCLIRYQPVTRGKHQLHITIGGGQTRGSPHTVVVQPRLGKPVKVISDFRGPFGVMFNSKGMLIVAENGSDRVLLFTPEGQMVRSFGSKGTGNGQFLEPRGVTVDGDDNIYVVDNYHIQKFTPNGEHISSVGSRGSNQLQFQYPIGIGFNHRNSKLYVCDNLNHRVQVLDTNFVFLKQFGSEGRGNGQFRSPWDAAFDSDGNVYVVEFGNHRIQVFTPEGQYLKMFGSKGSGPGQLSYPTSVAIDGDRVYVTESSNNRVSIFTTAGQFVKSFASKGRAPGQLNYPKAVTIDENAFIVVSDTNNGRIQFY